MFDAAAMRARGFGVTIARLRLFVPNPQVTIGVVCAQPDNRFGVNVDGRSGFSEELAGTQTLLSWSIWRVICASQPAELHHSDGTRHRRFDSFIGEGEREGIFAG